MVYGFYEAVSRRLGPGGVFANLHLALPIGCVLNRSAILVHGGVPEGADSIQDVASRGKAV